MKITAISRGPALWCCLMLAFVLSPLLIACGSTPSATNPNAMVNLNVWILPYAPDAASPPSDWELYKTVRDKLHINLKLSLIPVGDEGNTKLNAAAAANDLPDLFQVTDNNLFLKWVQLGLVAPVDKLLPMMPQRTKDRYNNATLNKLVTINGSRYILQEASPLTKRQGLFIRKDWLDKLGLQPPKTLDELLNVAKAFTFRDPDGNGRNDTYAFGLASDFATATPGLGTPGLGTSFGFIYGAFGLPGVWNTNTPGKVSLSVRAPGYLQGTTYLKQLADAKVIDPDWTVLTANDFRARWKQGKYGIISEDFCAATCLAAYTPFNANVPNGEWIPLTPPKGPGGQSSLGSFVSVGYRMGVSKAAMDSGKGPAIARLLEWLNNGEGYYLAAFGKEGVNYKLDAQGNITTNGVSAPFTSTAAGKYLQMRNMALKGTPSELKARYPSFKLPNGHMVDPLQNYQELAAMPWQDATSTYVIQPASNQADLNRYVGEGLIQFITSQKPLNSGTWNTFVKGLDNLNTADWETSANTQLKQYGFLQV
jgi:putative aldouronate transport system substrate-binding protein